MDRRVQSTNNRLVAALRALMQTKPWGRITIAMLCKEAEVSRSTFYTHFSDKQELLDLALRHLASELSPVDSKRSIDTTASFAFLPLFLDHVRSHRSIYLENYASGAFVSILGNLGVVALGLMKRELSLSRLRGRTLNDSLLFIVGGAGALVENWCLDGCTTTNVELLNTLDTLVAQSLGLEQAHLDC